MQVPAIFALIAVLDEQEHPAVFIGARRVTIPVRDSRACPCKAGNMSDGAVLVRSQALGASQHERSLDQRVVGAVAGIHVKSLGGIDVAQGRGGRSLRRRQSIRFGILHNKTEVAVILPRGQAVHDSCDRVA